MRGSCSSDEAKSQEKIKDYKDESSKLNQCIEILSDAIEAGHKILLFSGYTSMFDIIEQELKSEKIKYFKLQISF